MNEIRKTEILIDGDWLHIHFKELRKGDKFRLFEQDGVAVKGLKNETEFISLSDAYLNKHNIWQIDTED